jgi:hypothetical protein
MRDCSRGACVHNESAKNASAPETAAPSGQQEGATEKLIDLGPGGDLTPETAGSIASAGLTRLVFIAGEAETGKTTLLAAIYEKFNEGAFAERSFAGSETLVGWEKKCHLARIASGSERAETERTLGLQQRLLHLRLQKQDLSAEPQDVLFTDLSGEVFKLIRNSTAECQQLGMLKRADHFVLLVDGKMINTAENRHEAFTNSVALLRSCVDAEMVGTHSFVDVVFSKCDLLNDADRETSDFLNYAVETITGRYRKRFGRLRFHKVAARPESTAIPFAFGISDLLRSWLEDSPYLGGRLAFPVVLPATASQFDTYLLSRLSHYGEIRE